jgi:hypothetical protein
MSLAMATIARPSHEHIEGPSLRIVPKDGVLIGQLELDEVRLRDNLMPVDVARIESKTQRVLSSCGLSQTADDIKRSLGPGAFVCTTVGRTKFSASLAIEVLEVATISERILRTEGKVSSNIRSLRKQIRGQEYPKREKGNVADREDSPSMDDIVIAHVHQSTDESDDDKDPVWCQTQPAKISIGN